MVLTWAEYIDPEVVREFETARGISVEFIYFESDDARTEMLVANNAEGYDVLLVAGSDMASYAEQGWLEPIVPERLPNRAHIEARWAEAFPGSREYGVPYTWGTVGIAYRRDLVPMPITSWKHLLEPHPALRGKILMVNSGRDLMGVALKALGYSLNSSDPGALREAADLLRAQKPFVKEYGYLSLTERSALVTGEIWASFIYNGDALMLRQYSDAIAYVLPEEGSNLWVDYWSIARSSKRKQLAAAFIDFLNEPRNAARLAQFVYYATPNAGAQPFLPPEYFEDPVIYPDQDDLDRSEFFRALPPRAQRYVNSVMATLFHEETADAAQ